VLTSDEHSWDGVAEDPSCCRVPGRISGLRHDRIRYYNNAVPALEKRCIPVILWRLDKRRAGILLCVVLTLIIASSIVVGYCQGSISTGAELGGSLVGVVAVGLGFFIWFHSPEEHVSELPI
jgi:hypothetical protein